MQEQFVKIKTSKLTIHNQLEIVRKILWHDEFYVKDYHFGHFEFMADDKSVVLDFDENIVIITSYLSYNNFKKFYESVNESVEEIELDNKN